jgi:poly-gamma-glutamate synthesis protein (capsule biosynthesis protein)
MFKFKKYFILIIKIIIFSLILFLAGSCFSSCKIIKGFNFFSLNSFKKSLNINDDFAKENNLNNKNHSITGNTNTISKNTEEANSVKILISDTIPSFVSTLIKQEAEIIFKNYSITENKDKNEEQINDYDIIVDSSYQEEGLKNYIIYCAVTDFYNLCDNITLNDFKNYWAGNSDIMEVLSEPVQVGKITAKSDTKNKFLTKDENNSNLTNNLKTTLFLTEETYKIISKFYGECKNNNLKIVESNKIKDYLQNIQNSFAIIPFEDLTKELKVLNIDGNSVFDKNFSYLNYPFSFSVKFSGLDLNNVSRLKEAFENIFYSNRNPDKLLIVNMSGVTAMVRGVANRMDKKGILYPGEKIANTLKNADIVHTSNEVSFKENGNAGQGGTVFCSKPEYIELLKYVGVNLIELTGNHLNDYGSKYFENTLKMYDELGWRYFGGGINLAASEEPALYEINGNKIAFSGFNQFGPDYDWATENSAGSAPPDNNYYINEIKKLKEAGYNVIFTFQYEESYSYYPLEKQVEDFRMVRDAGADIVNGSQAHQPMGFELNDSGLICYGLGNLFFDQMQSPGTRQGIIAKHVFYNGKHISTQLIPTMIDDYCQPRLMTEPEKIQLLKSLFKASIK